MKNKPNISLINISELKNSGFFITVRKAINELINKTANKAILNTNNVTKNNYKKIVSVIICTSDHGELSELAANSVLNQDFDKEKYEIIIVNNSKNTYPYSFGDKNVRVIDEPTLGLSIARNSGAAASDGEYLLYIDDDSIAEPDLLKSMYNAFETRRAAIIGGQIYLSLPNPVPKVFLYGKESIWSGYTVPYKSYREINEHYEFPYGACFGIRHSVLDLLGGFPEGYGRCGNNFAGGEETAICFAAKNNGYRLGIEPNASVKHCVSPDRFTTEHIRKTIREGILTTYRLYKEGYSPSGWTLQYTEERLRIIKKELSKLAGMAQYYKKCEYDAFLELKQIIIQSKD